MRRYKKFLLERILSKRLCNSLSTIYSRVLNHEIPSKKEVEELYEALIQRVLNFYIYAFLIAIIPSALTIYLLFQQNIILRNQTNFFERQYRTELIREHVKTVQDHSSPPLEKEFAARELTKYLNEHQKYDAKYMISFQGANLRGSDLSGLEFKNIRFNQAILTDTKIINSKVQNCIFPKTDFARTVIENVDFVDCEFEETNFGTFLGPEFEKYGLRINYPRYGVDKFDLSSFKKTKFINCTFNNINVNFCDFRGTEFINSHWDVDSIIPERVYGAIFIGVDGLPENVKDKLSNSWAIVKKEDIKKHLVKAYEMVDEAKTQKNDRAANEILEAIKIYESLLF